MRNEQSIALIVIILIGFTPLFSWEDHPINCDQIEVHFPNTQDPIPNLSYRLKTTGIVTSHEIYGRAGTSPYIIKIPQSWPVALDSTVLTHPGNDQAGPWGFNIYVVANSIIDIDLHCIPETYQAGGADYNVKLRKLNGLVWVDVPGCYSINERDEPENIDYTVPTNGAGTYQILVIKYALGYEQPDGESFHLTANYTSGSGSNYSAQLLRMPDEHVLHTDQTLPPGHESSVLKSNDDSYIKLILTYSGSAYLYQPLMVDIVDPLHYDYPHNHDPYTFDPGIGTIDNDIINFDRDYYWQDQYFYDRSTDNIIGEFDALTTLPRSASTLYNCHVYAWTEARDVWLNYPNQVIESLFGNLLVEPMGDQWNDGIHTANLVTFRYVDGGPITHSAKVLTHAPTYNNSVLIQKAGNCGVFKITGAATLSNYNWGNMYGDHCDFWYYSYPSDNEDNVTVPIQQLTGNYPNPFNPTTTIEYSLIKKAHNPKLEIYNIKGQKVRTFVLEQKEGDNKVVWNGRSDDNIKVSSGIYFYKLFNDNQVIGTKKMVMTK